MIILTYSVGSCIEVCLSPILRAHSIMTSLFRGGRWAEDGVEDGVGEWVEGVAWKNDDWLREGTDVKTSRDDDTLKFS